MKTSEFSASQTPARCGDLIRLDGLAVACVIDIYPHERRRKQRVHLTLELRLNLERAGRSGRIVDTVDYGVVAEQVALLLKYRSYQLIEVATEEIAALLLGIYPQLHSLRIALGKPDALRERVQAVQIEIERHAKDFVAIRKTAPHGETEHLLMTREAELTLQHLEPTQKWCHKNVQGQKSLIWLVSGFAENQRQQELSPHTPIEIVGDFSPTINNVSALHRATLFCCQFRDRS